MRNICLLALALLPTGAFAQATPPTFDHQKVLESVRVRSEALATRLAATRDRVLALRSEIIIDSLAPTRLLLSHKNEMGASFKIESIEYTLDGVPIAERSNPVFDAIGQLRLLDGEVRHGNHDLKILVVYVGTGAGPYSTLGGFRYEVRRQLKIDVPEGRLTDAVVVGVAKTDAGLEAKQRFDFKIQSSSTPIVAKQPK